MQKMPSMPSGHGRSVSSKLKMNEQGAGAGILTLVLVLVSLVLFTFGVRDGNQGSLAGARGVAQTIVSPLRMLGAGIAAPLSGFGNVMRNLTADEKTLSELKDENERLAARNVELEEAELTAQRLQSLLDLRSSYNLQSVAARIIAGSLDSWTSTVTIDKGSAAGLAVGMPVVDENGAIGQIMECGASTSIVRLLSDESSSVSAMVQSSRAQGMLVGEPDGTLRLKYIRTDQTVDVGDIVVTSGLGGVFPKGLPMGKVASVETNPGSVYYEIVVEPFTHAGRYEEVLVITSLTEEQQATAEDIERADAADLDAASGRSAATSATGDKSQVTEGQTTEGQVAGEAAEGAQSSLNPDGTSESSPTVATLHDNATTVVSNDTNDGVAEEAYGAD